MQNSLLDASFNKVDTLGSLFTGSCCDLTSFDWQKPENSASAYSNEKDLVTSPRGVKRRRTENLGIAPSSESPIMFSGIIGPSSNNSSRSFSSSSEDTGLFSSRLSDDSLPFFANNEAIKAVVSGQNNGDEPSRRVAFSTVCVHEHAFASYHSSASSARSGNIPLRLGWKQERQFECTIEDYESRPSRQKETRQIPPEERRELLGMAPAPTSNQPSLPSSPAIPTATAGMLSAAERRARFIAASRTSPLDSYSEQRRAKGNSGLLPE